MSTYTPAVPTTLDQSADAGFRIWILELFNALTNGNFSLSGAAFAAVKQTTDTGQLTAAAIATLTRPAINTASGYIILAFTDTQAGSVPIYIKIEVGSGAATTSPSLWVTIAQQTNGAGVMGGNIVLARTQYTAAPLNNTSTRATYVSCADGYFIAAFKYQGWATTGNTFFLAISRGFDETSGLATADGYNYCVSLANSQVMNGFVNGNGGAGPIAIGTVGATYCTIIGAITSTTVSGVAQAIKWYGAFPRIQAILPLCSVLNTEAASLSSFTATLAGVTSHTYMSLQLGGAQNPNFNNQAGFNVGMIWE